MCRQGARIARLEWHRANAAARMRAAAAALDPSASTALQHMPQNTKQPEVSEKCQTPPPLPYTTAPRTHAPHNISHSSFKSRTRCAHAPFRMHIHTRKKEKKKSKNTQPHTHESSRLTEKVGIEEAPSDAVTFHGDDWAECAPAPWVEPRHMWHCCDEQGLPC